MPGRPPLLPRSGEGPGRDGIKWSVPLATGLVAACIFLGESRRSVCVVCGLDFIKAITRALTALGSSQLQ